jgi:hypothetical protein
VSSGGNPACRIANVSTSAAQVANLEKGMWESRMRSAVQLLGRAPVQGGEAGINAAAATVRAQCTLQLHQCIRHA